MIARLWSARATTARDADAYQDLFPRDALAHLGELSGFEGAYLLRRDHNHRVEVVTFTLFDSLDVVRSFAGDDYELANVSEVARQLLPDIDQRARHYRVVLTPNDLPTPG
jgi:heme-degrading monooxygenase HmoA